MHNLVTRILVSESIGSRALLLGHTEFAASKGVHEVHRHDQAGEFVYVLSGSGVVMLDDGNEVGVSAGSLTFIPAGEWHGFRVSDAGPVETIFAYAGVVSFNDIGYALKS